jgi:hypothetical protein
MLNTRAIGGLVFGLMLIPLAAAWADPPFRHMAMHRTGHMMDSGCTSCGPAVGSCCADPCAPRCCLPLIPAVLNGVDRLLSHIFCSRCYDPCCTTVAPGCSDCGGEVMDYSMVPSEMASRRIGPTHAGTTRAQQIWDMPRGSAPRVTRSPAKPTPGRPVASEHSVMKPKTAQAPQPRPAVKARPTTPRPAVTTVAEVERVEAAPYRETNKIQRTSFQAPRSEPSQPANPLRD